MLLAVMLTFLENILIKRTGDFMRCDCCPAARDDSGYEHDATEYWCAVGEEEREFADGSVGCLRRSVEKLKEDMKIQSDLECEAFAEECSSFLEFLEKQNQQENL